MKLVAKIEHKEKYGVKSITFTFVNGKQYHRSMETIAERHIGPRPWSEISFWKNGQAVRIFCN